MSSNGRHAALLRRCASRPGCGDAAFAALLLAIRRWLGSRVLNFDGSGCPVTSELLTDDVLGSMVGSMPRLRSLRLRGCPRVTDVGLLRVASAAPPLRTLALEWCGSSVYVQGLTALVRACPRLEEFSISCDQESRSLNSVGDSLAVELAAGCPYIVHLQLVRVQARCPHVEAIMSVSHWLTFTAGCVLQSDTCVGDSGLSAVARAHGPQLLSLALNYTSCWTAWGMQAVGQRCKALRTFSACNSCLTPRGLMMLVLGCPALQELHLDRCRRIDLPVLARALHAARSLRRVAMAGAWRAASAEQRVEFKRWAEAHGWELQGSECVAAVNAGRRRG